MCSCCMRERVSLSVRLFGRQTEIMWLLLLLMSFVINFLFVIHLILVLMWHYLLLPISASMCSLFRLGGGEGINSNHKH